MDLRPRKKPKVYRQVPYPDGDPQGPLQVLVAELDKEVFTTQELLATDDKLVHGMMCSKKNLTPEQYLEGMTFMDRGLVERIGGYIISLVYYRHFVPNPPYEEYKKRAGLAWQDIRREAAGYFQRNEERAFKHLVMRYTLFHHDESGVKPTKVKFGSTLQFGIAAKARINKNEYIYQCHGVTTRDAVNDQVNQLSVIMRTTKGSRGRKSTIVVMAGGKLVPIEGNTSAFALLAIKDIKEGEAVCIDYGNEYWNEEQPCLCSAHGRPRHSLVPNTEPILELVREPTPQSIPHPAEEEAPSQARDTTEKPQKKKKYKPRPRGGKHRITKAMIDEWKIAYPLKMGYTSNASMTKHDLYRDQGI